jgi:hypothetical protein
MLSPMRFMLMIVVAVTLVGCNREQLLAGPRLDIDVSKDFINYEGDWTRNARTGSGGNCGLLGFPDLSNVHDPRTLIVIPAIMLGTVVVIALVNGVAETIHVGRQGVSDDLNIMIVCREKVYEAQGYWGNNRIVLTDELTENIKQSGFVLRLTVRGQTQFDKFYQMPAITSPERCAIRCHPDGRIYINDEVVYESGITRR